MKPRTLNDLIADLRRIKKKYPELADQSIVSSSDDEGNSYTEVYFSPTIGVIDRDRGGRFIEFEDTLDNPNTVCVN